MTVAVLGWLTVVGTLRAQELRDRGQLAGGWHVATDWSARSGGAASLEDVRFVRSGDGYHVTLGPAAIFWREGDTASGGFRVAAAITQLENPAHPESYGVFVGGRDLDGEGQTYTYFLVRAHDGMFSIRRRAGRRTRPTAVVEWTAHDAVRHADPATGRATNELGIVVQDARVTFLVNGAAVHDHAAAELATDGTIGYRVNHRLDVQLGPLRITRVGAR